MLFIVRRFSCSVFEFSSLVWTTVSLGMVDSSGSPYPGSSGLVMPSPAARTWPGSPIVHVSPASRMGMAPSPGHPSLQASPSQHKDVDHSNKMGKVNACDVSVSLLHDLLFDIFQVSLWCPTRFCSSPRGPI